MRSDNDIKSNVEAELRCHPNVDESCIAVNVAAGTVTLMGYVRDFFQKYGAEDAVKRVAGVAAVANAIQVRPMTDDGATDPEIARACLASITQQVPLSSEPIRPIVRQGIVTLEGAVATDQQRTQAEEAVRNLKGVVGVINALTLTRATPQRLECIEHVIEDSLRGDRQLDASGISVEACGAQITLRGRVRTWAERRWAEECAAAVAGVQEVCNELIVRRPEASRELCGLAQSDPY